MGEIIDGTLYVHPRPRAGHTDILSGLLTEIRGPFQHGRGGPGGWWIHAEPGIRVGGSPEFVPDLAGWRRERAPRGVPDGSWSIAPDWACEILSPSKRGYDQRIKRPFYARIGIRHLWFIDLESRTLTASELRDGGWWELGVYGEDDVVRVAPFDAIELRLGELWPIIDTR
ncbi:Uma2 family endonuclease [Pyxidicoccus xibeiensis]|uniref:Uma2 family endonuclease n=1 Tax=Pyxidicoccus xibeiensis TaxID=2906759 RepID=UPI002B1FA5E0|nr:Uma2 family endonuclease [Pyxidicoccus xibeiensis]